MVVIVYCFYFRHLCHHLSWSCSCMCNKWTVHWRIQVNRYFYQIV